MSKETIVVVDTETTGFPTRFNPYTDASGYNSARMVSIAWQIFKPKPDTTNTYSLHKSQYFIIKPKGFTIPSSATKIHKITTRKAKREGKDIKNVLGMFHDDIIDLIRTGNIGTIKAVAHNINFDKNIILSEVHRSGLTDLETLLLGATTYCTMRQGKDITKIRSMHYAGYKMPKLKELYQHYFSDEFKEHDALEDTRACAKCYFKINNLELADN